MKRPRLKLPLKFIITVTITFIAVFFILGYLVRISKTLDYFKIKDIVVRETEPFDGSTSLVINPKSARGFDLSSLKGRNIFTVNLQKESRYILEFYNAYKNVRLIRILPNRLCVDFIKRKPLAYIQLYRYFCVDEEAVLFDITPELGEPDLPLILGLDTKIFGPKSGKVYNIRELMLALNIIKAVQKNNELKDCKIKKIDVAYPSNTSFFTTDGLEIRLGDDGIEDKINILSTLLIQVKNELANIKYIDLRFREPVIKFKNAQ
jgi:cell division septal protein FtsQ